MAWNHHPAWREPTSTPQSIPGIQYSGWAGVFRKKQEAEKPVRHSDLYDTAVDHNWKGDDHDVVWLRFGITSEHHD